MSEAKEPEDNRPAQPVKAFLCMFVLPVPFYLIDCILVTLFQDHPSSSWIWWGVHAKGPAGFAATILVFFCGIWVWIKEIARQAQQLRDSGGYYPPSDSPKPK